MMQLNGRKKVKRRKAYYKFLSKKVVMISSIWGVLWTILSIRSIETVHNLTTTASVTNHLYDSFPSANRGRNDSSYMMKNLYSKIYPSLTAYVEPAQLYTYSQGSKLSLRSKHGPEHLLKFTYLKVQTCNDIPDKLPVFHESRHDSKYGSNVRNVFSFFGSDKKKDNDGDRRRDFLLKDYAETTSPVLADPFLPWIHDVFPSNDGKKIEFIAHNRRRCNTDPALFSAEMEHLAPQVTLMQPIPVTSITEKEAQRLTPNDRTIWSYNFRDKDKKIQRYKLATSFSEATVNETRFICQFRRLHLPTSSSDGKNNNRTEYFVQHIIEETLSVYPYNYEHANSRKPGSKPMFTIPKDEKDTHGAHNEQVWNSVLHFSCPVPSSLQEEVANGQSILEGKYPTLFLDLVPIRTQPRVEPYFPQDSSTPRFDPIIAWGKTHVLPKVESSGRWSNIPVCLPPRLSSQRQQQQQRSKEHSTTLDTSIKAKSKEPREISSSSKEHFLIGCIWASASYTTRSDVTEDDSTSERLLEWLTYHIELAGFDHIYLYDNSGAHNRGSPSLELITQKFPDTVTRIAWSHRVCNNNRPSVANAGERSSQYAAESSCRVRYGPLAEWAIFFDTDEYLIPQGKWNSIRQWLKDGVGDQENSHILSFYQSRAAPNIAFMEPNFCNNGSKNIQNTDKLCLSKLRNISFLQTYDCDSKPLPRESNKWRAMKQIYRPWYVLNHFVHYSTVTRRILESPNQISSMFIEKFPYERRVDELNEAFMLHAKTTPIGATRGWKRLCSAEKRNGAKKGCPVGIAFPSSFNVSLGSRNNVTEDGMQFNCFQHERVQEIASKLSEAMKKYQH